MSNSNTNLQTQTSSVLQNVTVSSCSNSNIQEKTQLSRSRCMHSLKEIKSLFKFLSETLQDYGTMPIFKRTFSQTWDLLEQHLTKDILSRTDCTTTLTDLRTTFENAFNSELKARMQNYTRYDAQSFYDAMIFNMDSLGKYMLELILHQQRTPQLLKQKKLMQTQEDHSHPIPALNVDSLKVDLAVIQNTCSEKEDSNSETASSKLVKECSLNSETKDVHCNQIQDVKSKRKIHNAIFFRSLHSHLQVLSKDDLKGTHIEHGFRREFMSIFGQDVDTFTRTNAPTQMTATYFVEYTRLESTIRDTLSNNLSNDKKSVPDRNTSSKANWLTTKSIRTDSTLQDESNRAGNDTNADDADIRPIYDEEPMAELHPNKRQQQPDSTSSTSTLATTVTANGNFDLSYALSWKPCQGDSLNLPDHRAQVDQGSQIKMIQVKEMMQDNDLKNSKSKDKGSKSRSQSMDEQSHYKQDKTITRQSINVKRHIFNVIGGTEEFKERDLNIGGDC
ncbi:hypothetical protein Tco_1363389 [Tanacetum coccineum]